MQSPLKTCLQLCLKLYSKSELKGYSKTIANSFATHCTQEFFGTVGKVELISSFATAVWESWNVSDKYTRDNAGDLKQLFMDQTLGEDNRND